MPYRNMRKESFRMNILLYCNDVLLEENIITPKEHADMRAYFHKQEQIRLEQVKKVKVIPSEEPNVKAVG